MLVTSHSTPGAAQTFGKGQADRVPGIHTLMDSSPNQPAIITGVREAVLYTGRHNHRIACLQLHDRAVQVHCTLSKQDIEDFVLMSMGMKREFLPGQEAQ